MAGKRKYCDLRYLFMRGLIQRERWQRTRHYLKSAAECTSRAVVSLELSETPVKSLSQAKELEAIGGETIQRLKEIQEKKEKSQDRPLDGKFVSSAAALLVSLLDLTEQVERSGSGDLALVREDVLKCEAKPLCEEIFLEDDTGFCQAWWRIEILIKRDLVKRRQLQKESVYQLMTLGREVAYRLRAEREAIVGTKNLKKSPNKPKQQQNSLTAPIPSTSVQEPDRYLHTNDTGVDGIILEVDNKEMGGERAGLTEHCRRLGQAGVTYRSRQLPCGDYQWVWRCEGVERNVPLIVERKRADDIAESLKDGRFWRQVTKMLEWKEEFRKQEIPARIVYMIEGDPADYVVRCADKCGGIGKCGNPTLAQIKLAIRDLGDHPQLDIRRTSCIESTIQYLAVVTDEIGKRASKGDYDVLIVNELKMDENVENPIEVETSEDSKTSDKQIAPQNSNVDKHKKNTLVNIKEEVIEIGDDSQEISRQKEQDVEDCDQELPTFDQHQNQLPRSKGHKLGGKNRVVKDEEQNKIEAKRSKKVKVDSEVKTDSEKIKVNKSQNDKMDIGAELAVFSSFSEYSKLETSHLEESENVEPNKMPNITFAKINFKFGDDGGNTSELTRVSPHGKVYLMKARTPVRKKASLKSTGTVDMEKKYDKSCDTDPLNEKIGTSHSKSCHTPVKIKTENDHCEENTSVMKVKFPFGKKRNLDLAGQSSSEVSSFDESEFLSPKRQSETERKLRKSVSVENSSDSLPDIDFSQSQSLDILPDLGPSTSAQADVNERIAENFGKTKSCDVNKRVEYHSVSSDCDLGNNSSKAKRKRKSAQNSPRKSPWKSPRKSPWKSPRKSPWKSSRKRTVQDSESESDDDEILIDDDNDNDDDYIDDTDYNKHHHHVDEVDEDLIKQVLDILPHRGRKRIKSTLVRCKLNIEQCVAKLLDDVAEDVVDLT